MNMTYQLLQDHLLEGTLLPGENVKIKIDQTLTQDTTGTMVYLQLQELNVKTKATELSVAYIDHNTLQTGYVNADDHEYIKSIALKHDIIYSKAGSGICHQVHLERFAEPCKTLIGSDSHTPTAGGIGSLAIGAGGLDVAIAIAKGYYYLTVPKVYNIRLLNQLSYMVSAKDVILSVLQRLSVKGGVGAVIEYTGPGVKTLSVTDRATITNMGAELGATTSLFPSDEQTKDFLMRQHRAAAYRPLVPDKDAQYDKVIELDLAKIEPLVAKPHMPDNVGKVKDETIKVNQVIVGSCTNSSYTDMMTVAKILKGQKVHPTVSLSIAPGSANILEMLARNGTLADLIASGARVLESACGPCIGMGQAPQSKGVSLRTMNRNFKGRSGTMDAKVYLVSPETAAYAAICGELRDPRELNIDTNIILPKQFTINDHYIIYPTEEDHQRTPVIGPNIKPFPLGDACPSTLSKTVLLKLGDNITTDDITPSNADLLPYRSNIPYLAHYAFKTVCDDFYKRATTSSGGVIVAGENYGQGSSREHAALVPLYLGVKAVFAKSFARIHKANLINSGILPLVFVNKKDYARLEETDDIVLKNVRKALLNDEDIDCIIKRTKAVIKCRFEGSKRERDILISGGTIRYLRGDQDV